MRNAGVNTPVLMLTSKDTLSDTIEGLDCGADDYLKKPFEIEELLARVRSLLRRQPLVEGSIVHALPNLEIDLKSRKITTSNGVHVLLTTKEFSILNFFLSHPNEVLSQQQIYDHVFDFADVQLSNTIEVHIKNIRKKFKTADYEIPIKTIRGAGYQLDITNV
jgi:DNA-binding response OmpR family regulator